MAKKNVQRIFENHTMPIIPYDICDETIWCLKIFNHSEREVNYKQIRIQLSFFVSFGNIPMKFWGEILRRVI